MTRLRVAVVRGSSGSGNGRAASRVAASRIGATVPSAESSVAHRGRTGAAAAVSSEWRVGVDLEPSGAVWPEQLRFFLTREELAAARDLDATAVWCLKEAAWKAFGCAHTLPFKSLELVFARDGCEARVVAVRINNSAAIPVQSAVRSVHGSWIVATVAVRANDVAELTSHVISWPVADGGAHAR